MKLLKVGYHHDPTVTLKGRVKLYNTLGWIVLRLDEDMLMLINEEMNIALVELEDNSGCVLLEKGV